MTRADLLAPAERAEAAEGTETRKVLDAAFAVIFPTPNHEDEPEWQGPGTLREPLFHAWTVRRRAFDRMLDAEAYESAALMLVPEGWNYTLSRECGTGVASVWPPAVYTCPGTFAATPALALVAAACRAIAEERKDAE